MGFSRRGHVGPPGPGAYGAWCQGWTRRIEERLGLGTKVEPKNFGRVQVSHLIVGVQAEAEVFAVEVKTLTKIADALGEFSVLYPGPQDEER